QRPIKKPGILAIEHPLEQLCYRLVRNVCLVFEKVMDTDGTDIRLDKYSWFIKSIRQYCSGRISTDGGQVCKLRQRVRKCAAILIQHHLCGLPQILCPPVIAEALPCNQHIL